MDTQSLKHQYHKSSSNVKKAKSNYIHAWCVGSKDMI